MDFYKQYEAEHQLRLEAEEKIAAKTTELQAAIQRVEKAEADKNERWAEWDREGSMGEVGLENPDAMDEHLATLTPEDLAPIKELFERKKRERERIARLESALAAARKEAEGMRELLAWMLPILQDVADIPSIKKTPETELVRDLGARFGYGAIMDAASALWVELLKREGYPEGGAFSPGICFGVAERMVARARAALNGGSGVLT